MAIQLQGIRRTLRLGSCLAASLILNSAVHCAVGQVTVGSAAGWVVAQPGTDVSDIAPGENSTAVNVGPGVFQVPVPNTQVSPDGSAWAQTEFPNVRILADSTQNQNGDVAYAGAYFGDRLVFTGGFGDFTLRLRWDFDGALKGSGGSFGFNAPPIDGPREGQAAANFSVLLEPFTLDPFDLSETDFFKDTATFQFGSFEVPFFDPFDPYGPPTGVPGIGGFLFDELDYDGVPTGGFVNAYVTDENAAALGGVVTGARFTWQYGRPLDIGVLLEGWAVDGGVVDFSGTGTFTGIEVPLGTVVNSDAGGSYDVTFVVQDGDFNEDGALDCLDVDALVSEIASGGNTSDFDLTGDGNVNADDLTMWLSAAGTNSADTGGNPFLPGDANLDGVVDTSDFNTWNENKFTDTAQWCSGDFNADGSIDTRDFNVWNENKFTSSNTGSRQTNSSSSLVMERRNGSNVAVPEPHGFLLFICGLPGIRWFRRTLRD